MRAKEEGYTDSETQGNEFCLEHQQRIGIAQTHPETKNERNISIKVNKVKYQR